MGTKHAIIIGIETYMDDGIVPVKYAAVDAAGFSDALELHGFAKDDQLLLLDDDATKSRMESRIKQFMRGVGRDDVLYVFYAGYGLAVNGCNYLTCYDSEPSDPAATGIKFQMLFEEFGKCGCKRVVLFLDCCRGGLAVESATATDIEKTARGVLSGLNDDELVESLDSAENCACFSSCKSDEKSHSHERLGHGIWAHGLIGALSGDAADAFDAVAG